MSGLLLPLLVTCVEICGWLMQQSKRMSVGIWILQWIFIRNKNWPLKTPLVQYFTCAADVLKDWKGTFTFLQYALPLSNLNVIMFTVFTLAPLFAFGISHTVQCCFALTENTTCVFLYSFTVFTRKTGEHENSSVCLENYGTNKKTTTNKKTYIITLYSFLLK